MANVGESNQPNMYQPNHDNWKKFVETNHRVNFPETMANVGESNQPYMYQPNLVERRRLYHHNFKIFVETKLRENFPETFVKINIVLWILIGSIGIILQILCITNGNQWSSFGTGIWAGIICFLIALTIFDFSRRKTYQSYIITTLVVAIGGTIIFLGFVGLTIGIFSTYDSSDAKFGFNIGFIILGFCSLILCLSYVIVLAHSIRGFNQFLNPYLQQQNNNFRSFPNFSSTYWL
jgi:hypothetical protein